MRDILRQIRRAPARVIASIFALSLAVGAVGVMAIPSVTRSAIRDATEQTGLADIIVPTSPLSPEQLLAIASIDGVASAEAQLEAHADLAGHGRVRLVGLPFGTEQQMDRVHLVAGRMPSSRNEVVVDPDVSVRPGAIVHMDGVALRVVGVGSALWWSDEKTIYTTLETALAVTKRNGPNRLTITARDDSLSSLHLIADATRRELAERSDSFLELPIYLADGTTPIDEDIKQVSTMIGLLGIAAGAVALVLLASTTSTLIAERSREVAVMRALGARSRPLRRRLRRVAMGIAAASLVLGLPLGVFISNLIARLVLEEFVGITPDIGWSWPVLAASAAGALIGARIASAHAARRATRVPLAQSLRDREGAPFGRRWSDRLIARLRVGGLANRIAIRTNGHRRARSLAVAAQIAAGVGAVLIVLGLAASVNDYNASTRAPWSWASRATTVDPGLSLNASIADGVRGAETGVHVFGEVEELEIDVFGLLEGTTMFDPKLRQGRWFGGGPREAVVSAGFARHTGIELGSTIEVELANGLSKYTVVGMANDFGRAVYVDRGVLARDLHAPGMANVVWTTTATLPREVAVDNKAVTVVTATEMDEEEAQGRDAIVVIFGAIGAIVAAVAGLAVVSAMTVNLYERRHELAVVQAIGGRRRYLRKLVLRELVPVALVGIGLGSALGWWGTKAIIASFESSNQVDIGATYAASSLPFLIFGTLAGVVLVVRTAVRRASRRPIAMTLRSAA